MNVNDTMITTNSSNIGETYSAPQVKVNVTPQQQGDEPNVPSTEAQFIEAIEKANHIQAKTTECEFSVHKETKQIMIKVLDSATKEIIREIPSEKVLDMVAHMCEVAGVFVDEKR